MPQGLAQKIASGDVPETIEGKQVVTLDMGLLVAGTKYRGEFEERLKKLMDEIKQNDDIILMIDEARGRAGIQHSGWVAAAALGLKCFRLCTPSGLGHTTFAPACLPCDRFWNPRAGPHTYRRGRSRGRH